MSFKVIRDRPKSIDLDEFLSRPLFGFLATASDAGPCCSPVWFLWEDKGLWIIGNRRTDTFPSRIEREPRCAMSVVDFDYSRGIVQHVGFRGRAAVELFCKEPAKRLVARYLGVREDRWDPRFNSSLDDPDNLLIRFEPQTAVARDQSYSPSLLR